MTGGLRRTSGILTNVAQMIHMMMDPTARGIRRQLGILTCSHKELIERRKGSALFFVEILLAICGVLLIGSAVLIIGQIVPTNREDQM